MCNYIPNMMIFFYLPNLILPWWKSRENSGSENQFIPYVSLIQYMISYHGDKGYTLLGFGKDTSVEGRDEVLTSLQLTVQPIAFCNAIYGTIIDNTFDPFNEQIKKTLPNNFNDENLICASVPGRKGGTCKGDSGGILMKNEFMGPPINDFRAVQKAVVHG